MRDCTFIDCDFTGVVFKSCNFRGAKFRDCKFHYATGRKHFLRTTFWMWQFLFKLT
jgi:uncharacterized protein YjbI with pentapeptide repeats